MNTFKVDGKEIQVGGDVRVEVELLDGDSIVVILTHEGIITDCFSQGEHTGTDSETFEERFNWMSGTQGE